MTNMLDATFPNLAKIDGKSRRILDQGAHKVTIPAGTAVFHEGDQCEAYLLVLDGSVRVRKVAESGREIVLYRVEKGQTCVLTTSCLLTQAAYGAEGVTETEVVAVTLTAPAFQTLLAQSAAFRDFVFSSYATRIADLLMLIEEVAFGRIDVRLAHYLPSHADGNGQIKSTHQELATELGSAREVISRQLKDFEKRGWVTLGRGVVTVKDRTALEGLSG